MTIRRREAIVRWRRARSRVKTRPRVAAAPLPHPDGSHICVPADTSNTSDPATGNAARHYRLSNPASGMH